VTARIVAASEAEAYYVNGLTVERDEDGTVTNINASVSERCGVRNATHAEFMRLKRAGFADVARVLGVTPLLASEFAMALNDSETTALFLYDPDKWESPVSSAADESPRRGRRRKPSPHEARRKAIRQALADGPRSVATLAEATGASARTIQRDVEAMGLVEARSGREITYALGEGAPTGDEASD